MGKAIASRARWDFFEADRMHPPANIAKMAQGIPLDDADRWPWLEELHVLILSRLRVGRPGVLACSALKERYRRLLLADTIGVRLVYLKGTYELFRRRMATREGHYMSPELLHSQFEDLEEPDDAIVVDAALPIDRIVDAVTRALGIGNEPG